MWSDSRIATAESESLEGDVVNEPDGPGGRSPLTVIWIALSLGVLTYAAVSLAVGPIGNEEIAGTLRWVWLVAAVAAIFGAGIVSGRLRAADPEERRRTSAILIWALAEGQALLGITAFLIGGDPTPAVASLVVGAYLMLRYRPSVFEGGPAR